MTQEDTGTGRSAALEERLDQVRQWEESIRPGPLTRLVRRLGRTRGFAAVYRRVGPIVDPKIAHIADGGVIAKVYGLPFLLLHTTGAKSGQPRTSPLVFLRDGDDFLLVGTNFGQPKHPGWTANLRAHPEAALEVGPVRLDVTALQIEDPDEWAHHWESFKAVYPGYANYLDRRGTLTPRMFRLTPHG
ncbi:MAG: nitroreductase/quinone reductase family protein [Candidatus Nanopelagicales bacterium]